MKLYIASKLYLAPIWNILKRHSNLEICSQWIDHVEEKDMIRVWDICLKGLLEADALLCVSRKEDTLKGSLLEIGYALGKGIPCVHLSLNGKSPYTFVGDGLPVGEVFSFQDALIELGVTLPYQMVSDVTYMLERASPLQDRC